MYDIPSLLALRGLWCTVSKATIHKYALNKRSFPFLLSSFLIALACCYPRVIIKQNNYHMSKWSILGSSLQSKLDILQMESYDWQLLASYTKVYLSELRSLPKIQARDVKKIYLCKVIWTLNTC